MEIRRKLFPNEKISGVIRNEFALRCSRLDGANSRTDNHSSQEAEPVRPKAGLNWKSAAGPAVIHPCKRERELRRNGTAGQFFRLHPSLPAGNPRISKVKHWFFGCLGDGGGIRVAAFDAERGVFGSARTAAEAEMCLWLHFEPHWRRLYCVRRGAGEDAAACGVVEVFTADRRTGNLASDGVFPTGGAVPCHLAMHPSKGVLACANYKGGTVGVFILDEHGLPRGTCAVHTHAGSGADPKRQAGPHPHGVVFSPDARFAYVSDLGADKVFAYAVDGKTGVFRRQEVLDVGLDPGTGPRHIVFHPRLPVAYVNGELNSSIVTFAWDAASGALRRIGVVPLTPAEFKGENSPASMRLDPSGRFLYATNRGHDSIAVFGIRDQTGALENPRWTSSGGNGPWDAVPTECGRWVLAVNRNSNNVAVLPIQENGAALGPPHANLELPGPVAAVAV